MEKMNSSHNLSSFQLEIFSDPAQSPALSPANAEFSPSQRSNSIFDHPQFNQDDLDKIRSTPPSMVDQVNYVNVKIPTADLKHQNSQQQF